MPIDGRSTFVIASVVVNVDDFKSAFFKRMLPGLQVGRLFDQLRGTLFFMKDKEGRFVSVSRRNYERLGLESEEQIIGKTDADFFPPEVARAYREDDLAVITSREPMLGKVEIGTAPGGVMDWFVVNKFPVLGESGDVIGVMGTIESHTGYREAFGPTMPLRRAVEFMEANLQRSVAVAEIAERSGISERQLQREFHKAFSMSVMEYFVRTRLNRAAKAMQQPGARSVDVAHDFGFADQSAFTRAFRKVFGTTPKVFQKS